MLESAAEAKHYVEQVGGLPVILKPAGGGGGIGMRIIRDESFFEGEENFLSCKDVAQKYFGCGDVFLEKYIEDGRHIEVQIFGDGRGNVIHLGERECSVQRRSQKVVEEAPSPGREEVVEEAVLCRI